MRRLAQGPLVVPSSSDNKYPAPWITGNLSNINSPDVQKSYDGEENTLQANIQITGINGQQIDVDAATESFDEPLTMADVLVIANPFLVP
jgi:hypothetical protein